MRERRATLFLFLCVCLLALVPIGLHAQLTTGAVQGTVMDPSGAVIPGATVTLTNTATNAVNQTSTDAAGRFSFPAVQPGTYTLTIKATGFQTYIVSGVSVSVTRTYNYPVTLKIGAATQTVTVASTGVARLQTTSASIGVTLGGSSLLNLPSQQRNVASVLSLQPAVAPESNVSGGDIIGGAVSGAMSDQTTFLVDGGDATSDTEGNNSYAAIPGEVFPAPYIQVGAETTQELHMVTSSPTASFARSQGGQVIIHTRSGTNEYHGSVYEYYTGSTLGANSWDLNRIGYPKPHQVNNRFGFTFGGPILKSRLWFYGNYEGRRFRESETIGTDVPTATARQGILQFKNAAGDTIAYNLKTSTACGPTGGVLCDPRGIGINPTIQTYWSNEPLPNVPGTGDGLNSEQYLASYATPINEDYGLLKIDYKINPRWHLSASWRQQKLGYTTTDQLDIIPGQQGLVSTTPFQPRFGTFMLTGQIGAHFTNVAHGSFKRDNWAWGRLAPQNPSNVSGLNATLQVSGEGQYGTSGTSKPWADPVNFNTQNARARMWDGRDWYLADDATWLRGSHQIQFGGSWYFWNILHERTDNVLGGLTLGPIFWVGSRQMSSGGFVNTPSDSRPPICATGQGGACIQSADASRWDSMYSAMLGLVDHSSQVISANGDFQPNPPGTSLLIHMHDGSFYTYVQDTWQMRPSLTLTYGLNWGVQFPPRELNGLQALQQYTASGQVVTDIKAYYQQRQNSLNRGGVFPMQPGDTVAATPFQFTPIQHIPGYSRPINTYWGELGPRVAVAWQPGMHNWFFGNRQMVLRGGYSIVWNRTNAVGLVMTPVLTDGFMQIAGCNGPVTNGTCSQSQTTSANAFRIGIDGSSLPSPANFAQGGYPLIQPGEFSSLFSFNLDPATKPPWSHNISFDIQRTFPHNWMIDIGYIGRFSRNLELGGDLGAADPYAKDPRSGQTLGQAFDNLATYIGNGGNPDNAPTQNFLENMAVPAGAPGPAGPAWCMQEYGTTCTVQAAQDTSDILNGDMGSFMLFNYDYIAQTPLDPQQFIYNFFNYWGGWANYNAGFISVHKYFSSGLQFNLNYTYSHAIGTVGLNQQYIIYANPTPFNDKTGYSSQPFDRRQVVNANWYWVLPFGTGQRYATGNNFLNRIIGGWYASGIWTWQTGLPICVNTGGNFGDLSGIGNSFNSGSICAVSSSRLYGLGSRHDNVAGSGGIGTNGDPASGGSGINIFANPAAAFDTLSRPMITQNSRAAVATLREPITWNVDFSIGKNIAVTERYKAVFSASFFNMFNIFQPDWGVGSYDMYDLNNPAAFGVVTGQQNSPRTIQLGLRFEF
jgi:hypothetical protein